MNEGALTQCFTATIDCAGQRVDKFLESELELYSRAYIQKAIKAGGLFINGKLSKASHILKTDDDINLTIEEPTRLEAVAQDISLHILYEDEHILIVNKPKGMVVHPSPGHPDHTLVNACLFHCRDQLSGIGGVIRPGIVHRIDKDTTGAVCVCKTDAAHIQMARLLARHSIEREYRAIVFGNLKNDTGSIDLPIGRHKTERTLQAVNGSYAKEAHTQYEVLEHFRGYTYVRLTLLTGRTHQIRVHMAYIGHPVLGDSVYTKRKQPFHLTGQTLHAYTLGFAHPMSGDEIKATAPIPDYFEELLSKLRKM